MTTDHIDTLFRAIVAALDEDYGSQLPVLEQTLARLPPQDRSRVLGLLTSSTSGDARSYALEQLAADANVTELDLLLENHLRDPDPDVRATVLELAEERFPLWVRDHAQQLRSELGGPNTIQALWLMVLADTRELAPTAQRYADSTTVNDWGGALARVVAAYLTHGLEDLAPFLTTTPDCEWACLLLARLGTPEALRVLSSVEHPELEDGECFSHLVAAREHLERLVASDAEGWNEGYSRKNFGNIAERQRRAREGIAAIQRMVNDAPDRS